jgi:uncharacterized protein YecT (DUF1311 family)
LYAILTLAAKPRGAGTMKTGILSLTLLLMSLQAGAASFDCNKAATPPEKAICTNAETGRLDERLARLYAIALELLSGSKQTLKQEQLAWLKSRNSRCGGDNDCLDRAYHERIMLLEEQLGSFLRRQAPCESLYLYPHITRAAGEHGWEPVLVRDRFLFHELGDGQAAFYLGSVGPNNHACNFEGIAGKEGDKWVWEAAYHEQETGNSERCVLEFSRWEGGYLSVSVGEEQTPGDIEMACRKYNCGANAFVPANNAFIEAARLLSPAECKALQESLGDD